METRPDQYSKRPSSEALRITILRIEPARNCQPIDTRQYQLLSIVWFAEDNYIYCSIFQRPTVVSTRMRIELHWPASFWPLSPFSNVNLALHQPLTITVSKDLPFIGTTHRSLFNFHISSQIHYFSAYVHWYDIFLLSFFVATIIPCRGVKKLTDYSSSCPWHIRPPNKTFADIFLATEWLTFTSSRQWRTFILKCPSARRILAKKRRGCHKQATTTHQTIWAQQALTRI